jgi:protein-S-isoprenylcysteine O-methyltransferase Ste14
MNLTSFDPRLMHTRSDVQTLELKIPPLALVLIAALLMWLGASWVPEFNFQIHFQAIVAWILGFLGVIVCVLGVLEFKRVRTTVNPTKPQSSSSLVKTGIYSSTRNPMYLGFVLILAGWATATGSFVAFLALPAFVVYMNRFQIKPEERALTSIFGEEFKAYCAIVRRWI